MSRSLPIGEEISPYSSDIHSSNIPECPIRRPFSLDILIWGKAIDKSWHIWCGEAEISRVVQKATGPSTLNGPRHCPTLCRDTTDPPLQPLPSLDVNDRMNLDAQLGEHNLHAVSAVAQRHERMGFNALWTFETQHDPFMPLAFAATSTEKLKIGTNIVVAFARTPMATAMASWDLQRTSGGRFMLGLGTQVRAHIERRFGAQFDHPAARISEYVQCMRAIWDNWQTGAKPDFEGEFYRFKLMNPFFNPGPIDHPRIPIYIAGVNPAILRTAGAVADGIHVHPFHSVRYLKEVARPAIDEGARTQGKSVDDLELYSPIFAVTGHTPEETEGRERFVRQQIAMYASTPNYRVIMDLHGWLPVAEKLSKMVRTGDWDAIAGEISDEMMSEFAVSASPERMPAILRERYAGLLQRVSLYYPVPPEDPEARWQSFVEAFHSAA